MKLIALRDFTRVPALENVEIEKSLNSRHIHKGALFEIGKAQKLDDLKAGDKVLVAQLVVSGCVGDATDPKVVKGVQDELEIDKKREANAKKLDAAADNSALVQQLTALLAKAAK